MATNKSSTENKLELINKKGYIVLSKVGEGAFGKVYKVKDSTTNEQFAIKETHYFDEEGYDRAMIEVANGVALNHKNVVKFNEYFVDRNSNKLFITMELCDYNLSEWFTRNNTKNRSYTEGMRMFHEIACGIQYIHDQHIIHRDLKPANVLIKNNVCKVADFGFAKRNIGLTSVLGTPLYASPEQANGLWCEKSTDIYPLGLIMFEFFITFDNDTEFFKTMISFKKPDWTLTERFFEAQRETRPQKFIEAKELLLQMLASDPIKRPTIQEVLNNPFLLNKNEELSNSLSQVVISETLNDSKEHNSLYEIDSGYHSNKQDFTTDLTVENALLKDLQRDSDIDDLNQRLVSLVIYLKTMQISSQNYIEILESLLMLIGRVIYNRNTTVLQTISEVLFLIVANNQFKCNTNAVMARKVITKTLDLFYTKCEETQVNLCLLKTLLTFKLPQDIEFEYKRVVNIIIHNIDRHIVDKRTQEICFYLRNFK